MIFDLVTTVERRFDAQHRLQLKATGNHLDSYSIGRLGEGVGRGGVSCAKTGEKTVSAVHRNIFQTLLQDQNHSLQCLYCSSTQYSLAGSNSSSFIPAESSRLAQSTLDIPVQSKEADIAILLSLYRRRDSFTVCSLKLPRRTVEKIAIWLAEVTAKEHAPEVGLLPDAELVYGVVKLDATDVLFHWRTASWTLDCKGDSNKIIKRRRKNTVVN